MEKKASKDEYNCGRWRGVEDKGTPTKGSAGERSGGTLGRGKTLAEVNQEEHGSNK